MSDKLKIYEMGAHINFYRMMEYVKNSLIGVIDNETQIKVESLDGVFTGCETVVRDAIDFLKKNKLDLLIEPFLIKLMENYKFEEYGKNIDADSLGGVYTVGLSYLPKQALDAVIDNRLDSFDYVMKLATVMCNNYILTCYTDAEEKLTNSIIGFARSNVTKADILITNLGFIKTVTRHIIESKNVTQDDIQMIHKVFSKYLLVELGLMCNSDELYKIVENAMDRMHRVAVLKHQGNHYKFMVAYLMFKGYEPFTAWMYAQVIYYPYTKLEESSELIYFGLNTKKYVDKKVSKMMEMRADIDKYYDEYTAGKEYLGVLDFITMLESALDNKKIKVLENADYTKKCYILDRIKAYTKLFRNTLDEMRTREKLTNCMVLCLDIIGVLNQEED